MSGLVAVPAATADEVFACADGKSVRVTRENRAQMMEHPCVKAWFAQDKEDKVSANAGTSSRPGVRGIEAGEGGARGTVTRRYRSRTSPYQVYTRRINILPPVRH